MNSNYLFQEDRNKIIKDHSWVICGHQINLLGGPLFVLYKWISTLVCAEKIGSSSLFYMEGNDSDFFEISKIWITDKQNKHQNFFWKTSTKNVSCGLLVVDRDLRKILEAVLEQLPVTQHTELLQTIVLDSYQEGISLPEATSKMITHLFPNQKLYCFNATCSIYLGSIRSILERELENTKIGDKANVWGRKDGVRIPLFRKSKDFWEDRDQKQVDVGSLELLPNFLTRSVCQDFYFRTVQYIEGESEREYLSAAEELYQIHGVSIPRRSTRMNPLLLTREIQQKLDRLNLSSQVVSQTTCEDLLQEHLFQKTGIDPKHQWQRMEYIKNIMVDNLINLGIPLKEVSGLEKKCYKDLRILFTAWNKHRKNEYKHWIQDIKDVSQECMPGGIPQPKGMHMITLLNQYGVEGIQKIQNACRLGENTVLLD